MNVPSGTACTLAAGNSPWGVLTVGVASTVGAAKVILDTKRPRRREEMAGKRILKGWVLY